MNSLNFDKKWDVIILGAGPAGSSMAAALARQGWATLLLERHHLPHHKVCGEFLSPEAQGTLRRLGLYQTVQSLSPCSLKQVRLVSAGGAMAQAPLPGRAWGVSRYSLDAALARVAGQNGAELWPGSPATAVQLVDGKFLVNIRSKEATTTLQARAVVAACGRHTRPGLPPTRSDKGGQPYVGLKRHYQNVPMPAQVELYFFPGGYAGVNPIEAGQVNVGLLVTQAAFKQAGGSVGALIDKVAGEWNPALGRRLAGGRALPDTDVAVAPVNMDRPASPWEGMACVGDTAVMVPPLCGDGMAMALRSAELCAAPAHDFLEGRLSLAGWQAIYQKAWHAEFDNPRRVAGFLQKASRLPALVHLAIVLGHVVPAWVTMLVKATRP